MKLKNNSKTQTVERGPVKMKPGETVEVDTLSERDLAYFVRKGVVVTEITPPKKADPKPPKAEKSPFLRGAQSAKNKAKASEE